MGHDGVVRVEAVGAQARIRCCWCGNEVDVVRDQRISVPDKTSTENAGIEPCGAKRAATTCSFHGTARKPDNPKTISGSVDAIGIAAVAHASLETGETRDCESEATTRGCESCVALNLVSVRSRADLVVVVVAKVGGTCGTSGLWDSLTATEDARRSRSDTGDG